MWGISDLFPGLAEFRGLTGLPEWIEPGAPWSILASRAESGLIAQIEHLIESLGDGSEISQDSRIDNSSGRVYIHPSASIGQFVRIEGPCYIGANAEVRHAAYLRRGSWICEGALVGHATEVKNSILLPGSKAPHFNYVGDSVLGLGVNLGAGTILSNVRNDRREIIAFLEDGVKVETGLKKMGALIGDNCQLGCNVVTNPGTIISPGKMIAPNQTLSRWQ
jgi:bifunctional N-acetylglucosamine-1-phosphate-uridyltransferase/glucosamine-1-phosphate-acetyltransferase GlmU-like protein